MVGHRLGDADTTHPAMVAIVVVLTLVHKRLRLRRLTEIREYYEEQMTYVFRESLPATSVAHGRSSLRSSLAALHAVAANRHGKEKRYD